MKKSGLPPIAWALAGLLGVAAFMISLGQQDVEVQPEVASFSPSGLSAFTELLKKNGVNVAVDQQPRPVLGPNDIAVAFETFPQETRGLFGGGSKTSNEFQDNFWKSIKDGGTGILLPLQRDFLQASRATLKVNPTLVTEAATGEKLRVTTSDLGNVAFTDPENNDEGVGMTLWSAGDSSFLRAYRVGKGTAFVVRDAIGITNRFIDKEDNAKAYTSLVSMLAKQNKRVVFEEASFGNVHEFGLLETVGPWANAAWQQLLFLGLVIVFTLGKRFGLSEDPRPKQRSTREFLDAIADTFKRTKSTQAALSTAWVRADADLRLILKLPKDSTRSERDRLLPVGLQNALARLEAASQMQHVPQEEALDLVKRAQYEVDAFLGPHRVKLRSLAKLKA